MNIEAQQKPPSTVSQKEKEEEEEEEGKEEEAQRTPATEPPKETEAGLLTARGDVPREAAHLKTGRVSRMSRFKGVSWHRRALKWVAQARVQGKTVQIGYYITEEEAAHKYDEIAESLGRPLNFPANVGDPQAAKGMQVGKDLDHPGVMWNSSKGKWGIKGSTASGKKVKNKYFNSKEEAILKGEEAKNSAHQTSSSRNKKARQAPSEEVAKAGMTNSLAAFPAGPLSHFSGGAPPYMPPQMNGGMHFMQPPMSSIMLAWGMPQSFMPLDLSYAQNGHPAGSAMVGSFYGGPLPFHGIPPPLWNNGQYATQASASSFALPQTLDVCTQRSKDANAGVMLLTSGSPQRYARGKPQPNSQHEPQHNEPQHSELQQDVKPQPNEGEFLV